MLSVPVRPVNTNGAPRPGGKAWLGVCWSLTEVVWLISTGSHLSKTGDRIVLRSPLAAENATVFFSQEQVAHQAREGWEDVAVFFRGSCRGRSHGGLNFPRLRRT